MVVKKFNFNIVISYFLYVFIASCNIKSGKNYFTYDYLKKDIEKELNYINSNYTNSKYYYILLNNNKLAKIPLNILFSITKTDNMLYKNNLEEIYKALNFKIVYNEMDLKSKYPDIPTFKISNSIESEYSNLSKQDFINKYTIHKNDKYILECKNKDLEICESIIYVFYKYHYTYYFDDYLGQGYFTTND
ncbi:hypothetical protein [Empedobacter tilapiae]|uniref:hypothetical protein n=1 Tax=Empedobacter tilapiae TaxID=2491114 RepID=UPI0028D77D05|nr:hypothetical protein [Empedobacter tilapiae]